MPSPPAPAIAAQCENVSLEKAMTARAAKPASIQTAPPWAAPPGCPGLPVPPWAWQNENVSFVNRRPAPLELDARKAMAPPWAGTAEPFGAAATLVSKLVPMTVNVRPAEFSASRKMAAPCAAVGGWLSPVALLV